MLHENIIEYKIDIDSIDRDITLYPDPFNFVVKFAPIPSIKTNGKIIQGSPNPHILIDFRNVKYIKLETIILPIHNKIIKNPNYDNDNNDSDSDNSNSKIGYNSINNNNNNKLEWIFDTNYSLLEDRFTQLIIKELVDNRIYTTGDDTNRLGKYGYYIPPKPFGLILCDKILNKYFYSGVAYNTVKTYENIQLGNINQLSISFCDSYGESLKYNGLYTSQDIEERIKRSDPISQDDLRHPLNKKIQVHLTFIIAVCVANINNTIQYYK